MIQKKYFSNLEHIKAGLEFFFRYKNVDIKIHGLKLLDPNDDIHMENSGSIFKVTKDGLYIKTIDSKIVITHLQMPGKKVINKSDIYNAYSNYFE